MVIFAGRRRNDTLRGAIGQRASQARGIVEANRGTFYSAMRNVDFEFGNGRPTVCRRKIE